MNWRKRPHPVDCRHCAAVRGKKGPRVSPDIRFDAKVVVVGTGCHLWMGAATGDGYGFFWSGERYVRAHRWAWERVNGPIPVGLSALHRCDVPLCVNPAHLFVGTVALNAADMVAKNRVYRGVGRRRDSYGRWLGRVPAA